MSTDPFQAAIDAIFASALARDITYNGAAIKAGISYGPDPKTGSVRYGARIEVRASDITTPAPRVQVVIDGVTWYAAEVEDWRGDGYSWIIPLTRDERPRMR